MNSNDRPTLEGELANAVPVILYQARPPRFTTTYVGHGVLALLGFTPEEFAGDTWLRHLHEEDRPGVEADLARALAQDQQFALKYRFWNKGRTRLAWIDDRGVIERDASGQPVLVYGVMVDITQAEQARLLMQASESRYKALFDSNPTPMWIYDTDTLGFLQVNQAAQAHYGYSEAEFQRMTLLDIRPSKDHGALLDEVHKFPAGLHDAGIWTHVKKDGTAIQVSIVSHSLEDKGRRAKLIVATDVTRALQAEQQALQAERDIQHVLRQTVKAMAAALEQRDPYTAGHQRRVAELSTAIARKLGMPQDEIDGLELGALVHDIGKLAVPYEILAMPRRLTEVERMLVGQHPTAGEQMFRDIDFPWPIGDVIRHHHERLDGSGYPDGLKGEELSLAVRIVGVADVVEAISNHRPYRPGLGIHASLDELRKGRGTLYDVRVVDTCISLFEQDGYRFSV